jgi:uncharacterized protein YjiS (DUF1127 family)
MFVSMVLRRVHRWMAYRATVRQLDVLGERTLSDLGIDRHDIRDVARQAAQ